MPRLGKAGITLHIVFGTKDGWPRDTFILDREAASRVVDRAVAIAEVRHGRLIDCPDLKTAMTYWGNQTDDWG